MMPCPFCRFDVWIRLNEQYTICPHCHTKIDLAANILFDNLQQEKELNNLIDEIMSGETVERHNYIVVFKDYDDIYVSVKQDHNRPNDPDDEQIISEYILNNYGYKEYTIIDLNALKHVSL